MWPLTGVCAEEYLHDYALINNKHTEVHLKGNAFANMHAHTEEHVNTDAFTVKKSGKMDLLINAHD